MPSIESAIEEIDDRRLPDLIRDLQNDFARKDEAMGEELELLRLDEAASVLEQTVRECLSDYGNRGE